VFQMTNALVIMVSLEIIVKITLVMELLPPIQKFVKEEENASKQISANVILTTREPFVKFQVVLDH
jgi:hypothetical protein